MATASDISGMRRHLVSNLMLLIAWTGNVRALWARAYSICSQTCQHKSSSFALLRYMYFDSHFIVHGYIWVGVWCALHITSFTAPTSTKSQSSFTTALPHRQTRSRWACAPKGAEEQLIAVNRIGGHRMTWGVSVWQLLPQLLAGFDVGVMRML
eukprot:scaffold56577_cov37-Tisochrysis_lutea.AAC.2